MEDRRFRNKFMLFAVAVAVLLAVLQVSTAVWIVALTFLLGVAWLMLPPDDHDKLTVA